MVQQQGDTLLMTPRAGQAEGGPAFWAANVHVQQGRQENLQSSTVSVVSLNQWKAHNIRHTSFMSYGNRRGRHSEMQTQ